MYIDNPRKIISHIAFSIAVAGLCMVYGCGGSNTSLPSDAKPLCTFTPAAFATMFTSGSVTPDGTVDPANGFNFGGPIDANCRFYQWAEQMFLWVSSPAPVTYGGGGRVFESPVFFDVTPPDAKNQRHLIQHAAGRTIEMGIRDLQAGLNGFPIITSKAGSILEVVRPVLSKTGRQMILDAKGDTLEIARTSLGEKRTLQIFDTAGGLIERPRPIIPPHARGSALVQPIRIDRSIVFLDRSGAVIEVEQGQADNAILETQNGSLVYYSIMVNDVYAYYLTGLKNGDITQVPANFPTTPFDLGQITAFARAHGALRLRDSIALAVELKASWVEASTLSDPQNYIRINGIIPTYDKTDPHNWIRTGTTTASMALVGIHVVGSIANHPEMIWATFEHFENSPPAAYSYVNSSDAFVNVAQNTTGNYLFCASGATDNFNQMHMSLAPPNIVSNGSTITISPSNTIRWKAWGNASDHYPNQEDPSPNVAYANTKIISINNSVHSLLAGGDIRANYNFMGATWTFDGSPGNSANGAGTSRLCNTTMETYQQGSNTLFMTGGTCFSCHSNVGTASSHIFSSTQPLF